MIIANEIMTQNFGAYQNNNAVKQILFGDDI